MQKAEGKVKPSGPHGRKRQRERAEGGACKHAPAEAFHALRQSEPRQSHAEEQNASV